MKVNNTTSRKIINIVLAILIATGLWLYVVNVENPNGRANLHGVPVEIQGRDALAENGYMITGISDQEMDLKLTGKKKTLMRLHRDNVALMADVSGVTQEGEWDIACKTVFPNYVNTDSVNISGLNSKTVTITVEKIASKEIRVRGEFIGTQAEGCLAGQVETDPHTLELKGPESRLENIAYALVQVGGNQVSETIEKQAEVVLMGKDDVPIADLDYITISQTEVTVTIPVQKVVEIPLEVTFKEGGGAKAEDADYKIKPAYITVVELDGGVKLPESIVLGEIDLSQIYGKAAYSLPIHLPEDLSPWNTPAYASVNVSLESLETRQISVEDIKFVDVPSGCRPELVSTELSVWVRGDEEKVRAIKPEQISVKVDLSRVQPKAEQQRCPAQVSLTGKNLDDVGIVGTNYSVALYLKQQ